MCALKFPDFIDSVMCSCVDFVNVFLKCEVSVKCGAEDGEVRVALDDLVV